MKLAILYGRGDLPEEVNALARQRYGADALHFDLAGPFQAFLRTVIHGERLDPLKFGHILATFEAHGIDTLFFTGSFYVSDQIRAVFSRVTPPVGFMADELCRKAFREASNSLYMGPRFIAAATNVLRQNKFE